MGSALSFRRRLADDYRVGFFERFLTAGVGKASRTASADASLASRAARSRAMFLRTSMACLSASAMARTPSSAAKRRRSDRATLSADGSAVFFELIVHPSP